MNRTLIIAATVVVVVVAAITVWIVIRPTDDIGQTNTPTPEPQKFDTTSGQEMKPRWNNQGEGEDDGATDN